MKIENKKIQRNYVAKLVSAKRTQREENLYKTPLITKKNFWLRSFYTIYFSSCPPLELCSEYDNKFPFGEVQFPSPMIGPDTVVDPWSF